jgi:peptide methionine sulfoxide reductase MsrA
MREKKYRSAVYYFDEEQQINSEQIIKKNSTKN